MDAYLTFHTKLVNVLPKILTELREEEIAEAILRIVSSNALLSSTEFLILLHQLDIPVNTLVRARQICFNHPEVFTRYAFESRALPLAVRDVDFRKERLSRLPLEI